MSKIQGAVFDVDETLLDNQHPQVGLLHEKSRYEAVMNMAREYDITALKTLTYEENLKAFRTAKTHSLVGAVWNILHQKGVVDSEEVDIEHTLLGEIVRLKNELHADVLRQHGRAVSGAVEFVDHLADRHGIGGGMAVASSAYRRDIDIFFDEMTDLRKYFPSERIVAYEDIPHGLGKPHPEPFDRAFRTLELPDHYRRSVLAVEDDPRGVQSAKAAGLYVCAITTRYTRDHPDLIAANPDIIVDNYNELMQYLGN